MAEPVRVEAVLQQNVLEPRAFHWLGKRRQVQDLGRRWRHQGRLHWLVLTETNQVYELIYDEVEEQWLMGRTPADFQPRHPVV